MDSEYQYRHEDLLATEGEKLAARLHDLALEARIAMMTTVRPDGQLEARPMVTVDEDWDGHYWFISMDRTAKIAHLEADPRVGLTYAHNSHISVSGTAEIVRDQHRMQELWNDFAGEYFETTPDDPDLVLIKVTGQVGSLWEDPSIFERFREAVARRIAGHPIPHSDEHTVTRQELGG